MNNKDYRELQLSSSQLVIIFLAIIILGVIIFLLGVSVGKKQAQIVLASQTETEGAAEKIRQGDIIPADKPEDKAAEKKAVSPATQTQTEKTAPQQKPQNLDWFIQVGAFKNRDGAQSTADRFKKSGYNAVILDPYASDREDLYRVRIGGYATKDLAEKAKAEMAKTDPKAAGYLIIRQR
ncbi:MAG: SPOR domain-containing protein [Candidatus Aminicenantes bacterium]|jgi:cell division septation protein DedD